MSWWRTFRLRKSRGDLEDVLDGRTESDDALGRTMQAARAEGTPDELAGLEAATAAFRSARAGDADAPEFVPARRGIPVLRRLATATLATKVAIGVAAVAASAVTYAAVDVNRAPAPAPPPASTSASASASSTSSSPPSSSSSPRPTSSGPQPSRTGTPTSRSAPRSTSQTGSPPASSTTSGISLAGLCREWLARPGRHLGLANDPQFRPLLRAAGTAARIEAYCTDLVGAPTSASKPSRPTVPTSAPTLSPRVTTGSRLHANGVTGIEPSG